MKKIILTVMMLTLNMVYAKDTNTTKESDDLLMLLEKDVKESEKELVEMNKKTAELEQKAKDSEGTLRAINEILKEYKLDTNTTKKP